MRFMAWMSLLPCLSLAGCGPTLPTFPPAGRDAGLECGEGDSGLGACDVDEVCLDGRCFARCDSGNPCGLLETCSSEGVCVAGVRDAGAPVDAGPPDPCASVTCDPSRPICRGGACLQCESRDQCGREVPICDVGRGTCVAFVAAAVCSPCNGDLECAGPAGATLRCLPRSDVAERVCLAECPVEGCPSGFECDAAAMLCVPRLGASCTGVRAAFAASPCASDADCAPLGAAAGAGLVPGACFDPAGGDARTCHLPCSDVESCPEGRTCDAARGFCL